jgi:hypothetical protein
MTAPPLARTLVAASLAFALVAAAASGTAFTVNTVQGVAIASAASGSLESHPCTGAFDVVWSVSSGAIVGVRAVRIPTSTTIDRGLEHCVDMPYAVLIAERDKVVGADGTIDVRHEDWSVEWTGVTDPVTGSLDASTTPPASGPLRLTEGMVVQLAIGPDPLDPVVAPVAGPPSAGPATSVCDDVATGGAVEVVTIGGDEFCVHSFTLHGQTETFAVGATSSLDVEYLIVGAGGAGGMTLGGGGGAGEVLTNVDGTPLTLAAGTERTVVVGAPGRRAATQAQPAGNGGDSSFGSLTAQGGFGGDPGRGADPFFGESQIGGIGGRSGRVAGGLPSELTGGGGAGSGAGGSGGSDGPPPAGGAGGVGTLSSIAGSPILVATGGGGGSQGGTAGPGGGPPDGGAPGGGSGSASCADAPAASFASPGSGGGGGGADAGDVTFQECRGGDGSQGLVIVRYRAPAS